MEEKLFVIVILFISQVFAESGVLIAELVYDPTNPVSTACIDYNPVFHQLPTTQDAASLDELVDFSQDNGCEGTTIYNNNNNVRGKMVVVLRGNCTFSEKALLAQEHAGIGLLVVNPPDDTMTTPGVNKSFEGINITVALIKDTDFIKLQALGIAGIRVKLYAPDPPRFDFNLILIWFIAVFCVSVGSHWAGNVTFSQYLRQRLHLMRPGEEKIVDTHSSSKEEGTVHLGVKHLLVLVIVMCGVIVALYFLYDYLVYLIIAVFCIAGSTSLFNCIWPWVEHLPPVKRIPANRIPLLSHQPQIKALILLAVCCTFGITWAVERKASYAWVLQDIMGLTFCIYMQKTLRLPSFKVCTILLVLLFFYDIFFVFITKYFTKNGESIMVQIATGGGGSSGEQLPMVFVVPRLSQSVDVMCYRHYSLLGFGDIIVPGFLVSFCAGFDRKVRNSRVYFIGGVIAYGVGLIITFIALALMEVGQPALLYLVPCTLLVTVAIAFRRKELKAMWVGEPLMEKGPVINDSAGDAGSYQSTPTVPDLVGHEEEEGPTVVTDKDERQLLINRQSTG